MSKYGSVRSLASAGCVAKADCSICMLLCDAKQPDGDDSALQPRVAKDLVQNLAAALISPEHKHKHIRQ